MVHAGDHIVDVDLALGRHTGHVKVSLGDTQVQCLEQAHIVEYD